MQETPHRQTNDEGSPVMHEELYQRSTSPGAGRSVLDPEVAITNVICVHPDATLSEAAQIMRAHHIGDVIVVSEKGGKRLPVGIVTDRDITIETFGQDVRGDDLLVEDIMSDEIVCAKASDDVFSIICLMKETGVGRIPLVDDDGALVGIVTGKKLFQALLQGMQDLASVSDQQQRREQVLRH